jgi:hypothetical protein
MSKETNKEGKDYYTYIKEQDVSKYKNCANVWTKPCYNKTLLTITEYDICRYSKVAKQLLFTFAVIYTVITLNNIENRLDNVQKSVIIKNVGKTTNKQ